MADVKKSPKGSPLRKAGESVMGSSKSVPASASVGPKAVLLSPDTAEPARGHVVRRVNGLSRKPLSSRPMQEAEDETAASLGKQRVHLHSLRRDSATMSVGAKSHGLSRRRSIDTCADLPQLRAIVCSDACSTVAFSPDSKQLAGGFCDGFLRIFDGQSGAEELFAALPRASGSQVAPSVTNLRWRPSGDGPAMLGTTDNAGVVCLWRLCRDTERPLECVFQTEGGAALNALCFTSDRNRIAVAGANRVVQVYDIDEGSSGTNLKSLMKPFHHSGNGPVSAPAPKLAPETDLTFSRAAEVLDNQGQSETAELENNGPSSFMSGHKGPIVCLQADPVNPNLLFSGGIGRMILRWDLRVGGNSVGMIRGPRLSGDSMDISNDGQMLLTGSHRADHPLEIYDLRELSKPSSILVDACTSFSWSADEEVPEPLHALGAKAQSCMLLGVAWDSETNKTIAACGENENLAKVFSREEDAEQPLRTVGCFASRAGRFLSAAASPDGSQVAFGSIDGSVHLARVPGRSKSDVKEKDDKDDEEGKDSKNGKVKKPA